MTQEGLPSEDQLDDFWNSTEESEELPTEAIETPETEEETVTLSQEEYDTLKKGQMLQADYTRKRQQETARLRELEQQLEMAQEPTVEEAELNMDLDDSDLPDSVKSRVQEIDKIKRELEMERERNKQIEIKRRADEIITNIKEVEGKIPAVKNKAVKFAVIAYASQVLNNPTKAGFMDAAKEISKAFENDRVAKQAAVQREVKKKRATSPSVGSGGSAPVRTVDAPKNLTEAYQLVLDALGKIDLFGD